MHATDTEPPDSTVSAHLDRLLAPEIECLFQCPRRLDKPSGWWGHVPFAQWVVEALRPALLVELGTHHGVSYAAFCEAVRRHSLPTRCFAVDNWQGDAHAGLFDETVYQDFLAFNAATYSAFSELLRADFDQAVEHFLDGSIDLLHIDGFHSYEAVRHDFETWLPKLSRRAVVLLHDTNVRRGDFGVYRLFGEQAIKYPHFEFMHGHGLGLLAVGPDASSAIMELCALSETATGSAVRDRFAAAGARWIGQAHEKDLKQSFESQAQVLLSANADAMRERDEARQAVDQMRLELNESMGRQQTLHQAIVLQREEFDAELARMSKVVEDLRQQLVAASADVAEITSRLGTVNEDRDLAFSRQAQALAAQRKAESECKALEQGFGDALGRLHGLTLDNQLMRQSLAQGESAWLALLSIPAIRSDVAVNDGRGRNPLRRHPNARAIAIVARSLFFDARWYLERYPDVAEHNVDPVRHFATLGHAENRDPGPWFSTSQYRAENPDVAATGENPLVHFERHGRREGRRIPIRAWMPAESAPCEKTVAATPEPEQAQPLEPDATGMSQIKEVKRSQWQGELAQFLSSGRVLDIPTSEQPQVSIILVLHNQAELTFKCLQSLLCALEVPCEVVVVNNASHDRTAELLTRVRGCRVLEQPQNLHFLKGANLGARHARGEQLLFLNNDAQLRPGSLLAATRVLSEHADVGAVGGQVVLLDGTLQEAGSIIWRDGSCSGYGRGLCPDDAAFQFRRDVDFVSGACLMVRRRLFEALEGFDEAFAPAYYEETDLCMRLRSLGQRVVFEPDVVVDHYEFGSSAAVSTAFELMERNREVFLARHRATLEQAHPVQGAPLMLASRLPPLGPRVLFLDDQVPASFLGSGFPRAQQFIRSLHACGASIMFCALSQASSEWAEVYRHLPREVEVLDGTSVDQLADLLRERAPFINAVLVSRPHNMERFLQARRSLSGALDHVRVIYDAEAIFSLRDALRAAVLGEDAVNERDLQQELMLAESAHVVLAVSDAEAEQFRQAGMSDVRVLGFCASPTPTPLGHAERRGVLFVGRLDDVRSPNVDSVRWFIREIMPRLDRLLGDDYPVDIVGRCCPALTDEFAGSRVMFHGHVDDLRAFYERARVFVAPTRFAAGIPIKVQEAASHGVPAVVSGLIARQLGWVDHGAVLSADSVQGFVQQCELLYRDEAVWLRTRVAALAAVGRDCDPEAFSATVRKLLGDLVPSGASSAGLAAAEAAPALFEDKARVVEAWSVAPAERFAAQGMNWMVHPMVTERLNAKASGSPAVDAYGHLKKLLEEQSWSLPASRAASLGSGFGALELGLARIGLAKNIDGYDLAERAVQAANARAAALGEPLVRYHVGDLERLELPASAFDLVFGFQAIHHVNDLDRLFRMIKRALRPGGVLHMHEYVGPDRFQWSDTQLAHMNAFLDSLPPRYHRLPNGMVRGPRVRPEVADVVACDPSEAIRSSEIIPVLKRHFRVLELRELGGALLHMGLSDIAQNFDPNHPVDRLMLRQFFDLEDRLMAQGVIASDFAVIVAIND